MIILNQTLKGFKDLFTESKLSFESRVMLGQLYVKTDIGPQFIFDAETNEDFKIYLPYFIDWFTEKLNNFSEVPEPIPVVLHRQLDFAVSIDEYVKEIVRLSGLIGYFKEKVQQYIISKEDFVLSTNLKLIDNFVSMRHILTDINDMNIHLNQDYDGEKLYPTATLTYVVHAEHLKALLENFNDITNYPLLVFKDSFESSSKDFGEVLLKHYTDNFNEFVEADMSFLIKYLSMIELITIIQKQLSICLNSCNLIINKLSEKS